MYDNSNMGHAKATNNMPESIVSVKVEGVSEGCQVQCFSLRWGKQVRVITSPPSDFLSLM